MAKGNLITQSLTLTQPPLEVFAKQLESEWRLARDRFEEVMRPAALLGTADDVVKPGLSDDVLQRLALLRPPVDQGEAEIRWGKPSKFQINEPDQPTEINYTTIIKTTGGTTVDVPDGAKALYFDEVGRNEEQVRVENPNDPEQYVIEARATAIAFQGREDGIFRVFTFNYPS